MTTNSHPEQDPLEDELLTQWLAPLDEEAAEFPEHEVERITNRGRQIFLESHAPKPNPKPAVSIPEPTPKPETRQRTMLTKALVAISALLGTLTWFATHDPVRAEVTLGSVLDQTTAAKTLKLQITKDGETATIWVQKPGQVRWETTPQQYRIAQGSKLWRIDETTNTAQTEAVSWVDQSSREVDLLGLIGLEHEEAMRFREATPAEEIFQGGKSCQVFRMTTTTTAPPVVIEAIAEKKTGQLQSLAVWPKGKRQGPPLTELAFIAQEVEVDAAKFVVDQSLTEDGRIGKLTDSQGIVTLKPMLGARWTPISRQMLVKPGDWLRTDVRGANAATVALTSQYNLIAGPGTLVELQTPHKVRVFGGEIKITGIKSANKALEILHPKDNTKNLTVKPGTSAHYRLSWDGNFVEIKKPPVWLAGYEGTSANESIGSLIAKIDGRDVPLTVGFHKVKVEIRDQIARTTIEESFVNRTDAVLEGVFHFPLPQDASISGFGMWINGELIEADVVEKQRAREIYETILREKRDPGLLEWAGGNIFKARVYPIPARGEKRIQIVYTQVLPLRANRYRYSYGLRSELLRKTPMRELALDVQISSALPIKKVDCPTHAVRTQLAKHSAKLEFSAQEYTPERDFEIVCEVDSQQNDVVVIPHQRGEDGYFLVQLTPPGAEGNWQREILPDGEPLELLIVCDTSASMDSHKRKQQAEFLASLLTSLGPQDRFNLAVCDVDCEWLSQKSLAPKEEDIAKARTWLEKRISLGWTNLDRMAESVLKRLGKNTHLIYVGDGIVTANDADPQTFLNRLKLLTDNKRTGTFHAVSVGSSFESRVLNALANVGGGSVRQVGGEQTPQQMAFELLNEIAQPGLRDVKVEFRGLQVAAVYPENVPNLAAGTQQILIGRYLPSGKNQSGEIRIHGKRGNEPVTYTSRISVANAESGNSFIPRLWARAHLDHLLEQGGNSLIKDQIISLSEEFHIITPYTSLLVLESDADRERFGVKRRYQMRDGERFFAKGQDQSHLELLQQHMKLAGDWRVNLRRTVMAQLTKLGRNPNRIQQLAQAALPSNTPFGSMPMSFNGISNEVLVDSEMFISGGEGGGFGGFGGITDLKTKLSELDLETAPKDMLGEPDGPMRFDEFNGAPFGADALDIGGKLAGNKRQLEGFDGDGISDGTHSIYIPQSAKSEAAKSINFFELDRMEAKPSGPGGYFSRGEAFGWRGRSSWQSYVQWVYELIPTLPNPSAQPASQKVLWKGEALEISKRLLQPIQLKGGGLEFSRTLEYRNPDWNRITSQNQSVELYQSTRWLNFTQTVGSQTYVNWCDQKERGVASRAYQIGRVRASTPEDVKSLTPGMRSFADSPLYDSYRNHTTSIAKPQPNRVVLTLTANNIGSKSQIVFTIDTERNIILEIQYLTDGKLTYLTKYSQYAKVAGAWWPGRVENFDDQSRSTSIFRQTVKSLNEAQFENRFAEERPNQEQVRILPQTLPTVRDAEKAQAKGAAGFEEHLVLLVRASQIQQWEDALIHLTAMEQFRPNHAGNRWIRCAVLISARKNEDARKLLQQQADNLVQNTSPDDYFLANHVLNLARQITDQNEVLEILDRLKPVFERQPKHASGQWSWKYHRSNALSSLGRTPELLALQKELAVEAPWNLSAQTTYAGSLMQAGESQAAYAWLRQELNRKVKRQDYEVNQLRETYAEMLREEGKDEERVGFIKEWIDTNPTGHSPYQQYLSALIFADRTKEANALVLKWMTESRVPETLDPPQLAKLNAAIHHALGERHHNYQDWVESIWLKPLQETAIYFLHHKHHSDIPATIIDRRRFGDTDENDRIIAEVAKQLVAQAETLPVRFLHNSVRWVLRHNKLSAEEWKPIAQTFRKRWNAEKEESDRQTLGNVLVEIYESKFADTLELPFRRERITRALEEKQSNLAASYRKALFEVLLSREWSEEHEVEAFGLIDQLTNNNYWSVAESSVSERMFGQVSAIHQWVDTMLEARQTADWKKFQDAGHPEKLTRTELAQKKADFKKSAQEGVAKRLANRLNIQPDAPKSREEGLVFAECLEWVRLERMHLDLTLGRNQNQVAKECWAMLGEKPVQSPEAPKVITPKDVEAARQQELQELRRQRAFVIVCYLAVKPSAKPADVTRVKNYIASGLKWEGDAAASWKKAQYGLLVALDEPEQLALQLREWIRVDEFPAPWQTALAKLEAERGNIKQAITLMESVERETHLSPSDYQALGDWYLVVDRKADYRKAKVKVFKVMQEYRISNWIRERRSRWQQTENPLPTELDERVLFAFQALFEKSNHPQNYAYELAEFYTACRDFRLLQMVPDALIGRTPQQIYPFLTTLKYNLLHEIRKEATADELLKRLTEVRATCKSPVDLRALDLLEALIERQASAVLNQPGPHIEASLAALKRAFEREWAEGEVRQMAEFLDSLGTIKQPKLNAERVRQLRALHQLCQPGTEDRLFVAWNLGHALHYYHDQKVEALAVMEIAHREYLQAHPDGWPNHANRPLNGYVGLLESAKQFAKAEQVLTTQIEHPINPSQKYWLLDRRNDCYLEALRENGLVTLGSGETLYHNLLKHVLDQLQDIENENHRYQTVRSVLDIFRAAKEKNYAYQQDLRKFAFDQLPSLLVKQQNNYYDLIIETSDALHSLISAQVALEYLIVSYENYPKRYEYTWQSAWNRLSSRMAGHHQSLNQKIGGLEPRLLAIVKAELRRDLQTRYSRSRYFYADHNYYWSEKANVFAQVAEEVLKERKDSGRSVAYIAEYLYNDLNRYNRAIEILLAAHDKHLLSTSDQIQLCEYLHAQNRHAESIPILVPLVREFPNKMRDRMLLVTAYNRASRSGQMRELLTETETHFRQQGRWTEVNIAQMATTCLENKLYADAVKFYGEVIPLHQRMAPNRGIGQGALSKYYSSQAEAYSGLGNTEKAVDAASAGVVAWGPRHSEREQALATLEKVLFAGKDLDSFVKHLDKKAEQEKQDSPIIRQRVGQVYADSAKHQQAVGQFRIALELQPTDVETHQLLIKSYDALNNKEAAVQQTLALLDLDRHNLQLYEKLAERLAHDDALSERAATTIVEAAPKEAEHHQALAELRQKQNRWPEAIQHWQHVAEQRSLEPNGLLNLTSAQIHEKRFPEARESLKKLHQTEWPARFSDLTGKIQRLEEQIPLKD